MTDTHTGETDIHIDVIPTKMVEGKIINQEDQAPFKSCSHSIEEMRLEQARMIDWICILLITTSIVASTVSFCMTKVCSVSAFFHYFHYFHHYGVEKRSQQFWKLPENDGECVRREHVPAS